MQDFQLKEKENQFADVLDLLNTQFLLLLGFALRKWKININATGSLLLCDTNYASKYNTHEIKNKS